jgi:pimeloyl-ACP methyl ester carboxylesterase
LHPEFPRWNIEGLLSAIVVPALLIQGAEDQYGTIAQIDSVAGRVRGRAERVVLEARHAPHLEAPYDTLVRVARFLDTVG